MVKKAKTMEDLLDGDCKACRFYGRNYGGYCTRSSYDDLESRTLLQLKRTGSTKGLRHGEFGCMEFELAAGKHRSPRPKIVFGEVVYVCVNCGENMPSKRYKCPHCGQNTGG